MIIMTPPLPKKEADEQLRIFGAARRPLVILSVNDCTVSMKTNTPA